MLSEVKKGQLIGQGYRFVGNHSVIKTCLWCRKAMKDEGICYKGSFYGIKSWRCVQMSPAVSTCNHRCLWCWRDINFTECSWSGPVDEPADIVDGCIAAHREILQGYGGYEKANRARFREAMEPMHFAISLIAEPTFYPRLDELIDEINGRGLTTFLVTNGTRPAVIEKLAMHQPTQLYITLPAPNEKIYAQSCQPLIKGSWQEIQKSLSLMHSFKRSTCRLTLVKGLNMTSPDEYAEILSKARPDFVECKAYMAIGFSKGRLPYGSMPSYEEIKEFARQLNEHLGYEQGGEARASRVVLLSSGRTEAKIDF